MARGGLVVRAPNHLGDLVMALPALALAGVAEGGVDVQVVRGLAPLLGLAGVAGKVLAFDRGRRGFVDGVRAVRRGRYARGVLLPPSLGSALVFALGGVRTRRGAATDRREVLLTERVARSAVDALHRVDAYCLLVGGRVPGRTPAPRLAPDAAAYDAWDAVAPPGRGPLVGVFPGSNAPSRRWDVERFAEVARGLADRGATVAVFGGPAERALTRQVAGDWACDLGGRTSLPALAAGLARCRALVTNDSGPQHVAAAVGTPVVALWGAGDPRATAPVGSGHLLLRHPRLPCVPCAKNVCPRAGAGYVLGDARNECIRLTPPADVLAAAERLLG